MRFEIDEGYEEFPPYKNVSVCDGGKSAIWKINNHSSMPLPQPLDGKRPNWNLSPIKTKNSDSRSDKLSLRRRKHSSVQEEVNRKSKFSRETLEAQIHRLGAIVHNGQAASSALSPHTLSHESSAFAFDQYSERSAPVSFSEHREETFRGDNMDCLLSPPIQRNWDPNTSLVDRVVDLTLEEAEKGHVATYVNQAVQTDRKHKSGLRELWLAPKMVDDATSFSPILSDNDNIEKFGISTAIRNRSNTELSNHISTVRENPVNSASRVFFGNSNMVGGVQRRRSLDNMCFGSKAPFCSTVGPRSSLLTHAIHANEQQIIALVNQRFPHWRFIVKSLLTDEKTRTNIAVCFLAELESRRKIVNRRVQHNIDIHHDSRRDELLMIKKLRSLLSGGTPSTIQQLRILYNCLHEAL